MNYTKVQLVKLAFGKFLRAARHPSKLFAVARSPYWQAQARLAINWALAGSPRVYHPTAYAPTCHPSHKVFFAYPPVRYTLYPLADICHFWNSVPDWNEKPFVVEFEHVLALAGNISVMQHGLSRIAQIQRIIADDRCRVALTLSRGLMEHSKRYISDATQHKKFDYAYQCYPTQTPRVMDLQGPFTILTIARRFYDKGVPVAIRVLGILRERYGDDVRMLLVCNAIPPGYPIPEGVTVYTDARLSDALKRELYCTSHVLFLPVLSDTFGCFPEAYAYGTPVVTTRIHHGDETVREGITGFLVDPPFFLYSDVYGSRWKVWEEFLAECKKAFELGDFNDLIEQSVDRLERMLLGEVDLRAMSAVAQEFHREVFSIDVRNRRLRQVYRRVASLAG